MIGETHLAKAKGHIEDYCHRYNISTDSTTCDLASDSWKNGTIPFATDAGCYLFYSESGDLLYIGKASLMSSLGARIASYYGRAPDYPLKHSGWTSSPSYLLIVKMNEPWEAPSLEEYLIAKLQPCDNDRGILRQAQSSALPPAP